MRAPASRTDRPAPAVLLAAFLLSGCDLFGTKDFSQRPAEVRAFAGGLSRSDTIAFRIVESLADPGAREPETVLARRQIRFARAPDPLQGADGWIAVSFRVYADPPQAVLDEGLAYVRFEAAGVALRSPDSSSDGVGGARYFPLKVAAGFSVAPRLAGDQPPDTASFLALPPVFLLGAAWTQDLGVFTVEREAVDLDTLEYRDRLEESWRIEETLRHGTRGLGRGTFWYGATGLLKGEQAWSLDERGPDGGLTAARELRRELVRL